MARNTRDADGVYATAGADDLGKLFDDGSDVDAASDEVLLSATDETIALLNSAFAGDVQGVDVFSGWTFFTFA